MSEGGAKTSAADGSVLVRVLGQWLVRRSEAVGEREPSMLREPLYESLFGKQVIGVFFAGAWDPASCAYAPQLAQLYRTLLASDDPVSTRFEVVFASCDRDEAAFNHFFAGMPWLALPFNDRARVASLQQRLGAHTLPALVLLDGADARVLALDGRHRLTERPLSFPWHHASLRSIVDADAYVDKAGALAGRGATEGCALAFFFGAKWSAESMDFEKRLVAAAGAVDEARKARLFDEKLAAAEARRARAHEQAAAGDGRVRRGGAEETREEAVARRRREKREARVGRGLRVVYVGFDEEPVQFASHFARMPAGWLALPYAQRERADDLRAFFGAEGRVPAVALVDAQGEVLNADAAAQIAADPGALRFPWEPPAVRNFKDVDVGLALNGARSMVVLMEDFGEPDRYDTEWEAGRDLTPQQLDILGVLDAAGADELERSTEAGVAPKWRCYAATTNGTIAMQLRHLIGGISRCPLLLMLDVPGARAYVSEQPLEDVTDKILERFLERIESGKAAKIRLPVSAKKGGGGDG